MANLIESQDSVPARMKAHSFRMLLRFDIKENGISRIVMKLAILSICLKLTLGVQRVVSCRTS